MPSSPAVATPRIPSATYRVQFHKGFTFNQAREIVPYLAALGITDLYGSPFFQASPGSTHGYDIVDHNHLNPEVGTPEEFDALCAELKKHGMGLVADFVPNHMGIAEATNGWWMDVLENGPSSSAAKCFDIDWHPLKGELNDKVLLPILGDQYGRVLEKGELTVSFEAGSFFLNYYANRLPINPRTYNQILAYALEELKADHPAPTVFTVGTATGGDAYFAELQSIMTQLENMPLRTETDPARIAERAREKEVAKARLEKLSTDQPSRRRRHRPRARTHPGHAGRRAFLRHARHAHQRAGLPPELLARRGGGDQLPPLLRHQHAGRHPHGIAGGFRGHAPTPLEAARRGKNHRRAHRPPGRVV